MRPREIDEATASLPAKSRDRHSSVVTRMVMVRRDTRGKSLAGMGPAKGAPARCIALVRHPERDRKLVCLGRARDFAGCRSAAHEGVSVESLEVQGD